MSRDRVAARALGVAGVISGAALLYGTAFEPAVPWERFFGRWNTGVFLLASATLAAGIVLLVSSLAPKPVFAAVFVGLLAGTTWGLLEGAGFAGFVSYPALFGQASGLGAERVVHADVRGETHQDTLPVWGVPLDPIPFHFRTDRHGLRNAVDRGSAELYVVGDSLIVSGLVPIQQTLTAQLENALDRPAMAVALNGISVQAQHELFASLDLPVEEALVLQVVFEGNDLLDSRHSRTPGSAQGVTDRTLASNAIRAIRRWTASRSLLADTQTCRIRGELVSFFWTDNSYRGLDAEIPEVLASLGRSHDRVATAGGAFGVLFVPSKLRVLTGFCAWPEHSVLDGMALHENPLRGALLAWSREQGVPVLDLTESLRRSASETLPWFRGDSHWNAVGQSVAAAAIADWGFLRDWNERR